MSDPKMNACRCFRYIAHMVEDPKVRELCYIGEQDVREVIEELKRYKDAELVIQTKRKAK